MKKVPIISPNSARLKKDDYTFFVLRSKASTLESTNKYKDIFCVVRDSYADLVHKDGIKNGWHSHEDSNARKNECFLPSKETPEFFRNAIENTTEIDKLPISSSDTILSNRDVTTYSACNNNRDNHEDNYDPDTQRVFDHKLFRMYLMFFFAVHPNSSISYVGDDDKVRLVQTETEFLELWKFAKSCSKRCKGVLLLVDFTTNQNDSMINSKDEISTANNQRSSYTDNVDLSQTFQSNENMTEEKENDNVEFYKKLFSVVEDNDNNLSNNNDDAFNSLGNLAKSYSKKEIGDTKLENIVPTNINSQDFLNNDPPMWFVRYMEQLKKDIITEVSDQIMANVIENLNECSMKSWMHTQYRETFQCENQAYDNKSKCNHAKNWKKDMIKIRKKKEKKLEEKCEYNSEDDDNGEKENTHNLKYNTLECMNNANHTCELNDTIIENETVNNRDSVSPDFHEFQPSSSKKNLYESNDTLNENETINNCDSISPDFHKFQVPSSKENLYKHEILDKKQFESKICCCGSDIENISVHSDVSNGDETCNEYTFEMIQKPTNCEGDASYTPKSLPPTQKFKSFFLKKSNKKDTKDVSSFELFPEASSPSSSSIYINEDHFTANSNKLPTSPVDNDINISSVPKSDEKEYFICEDGSKKLYNTHSFDDSNKCINSNVKEFTSKICKSIIENSSNPYNEETWSTEAECVDVNNMKTDVNNSHISYMTTEPINTIYSDFPDGRHSCQAQTDINDLTQSFHSHTTSITDNGVYDIRETNTSSSHDYSKHSLSDSNKPTNSKENKSREHIKKDFNIKNPEKKILREESNIKNSRHAEDTATNSMPGSSEPVHILPETLVNGALHFASFAYGTAREAIVKIRSNSKDDRSSHTRKTRH